MLATPEQTIRLFEREFRLLSFGNEFWLLRPVSSQTNNLPEIGRWLYDRNLPFVEEVIAGETEICLKLNKRVQKDSAQQLEARLASESIALDSSPLRTWQVPVWFSENDDWDTVSKVSGEDRESFIDRLLQLELRVTMLGFLPGFVYLSGLPEELQVPRKANPDKRTQPNSLAIGGPYVGVYSLPSPAGWNIIGQLGVSLLNRDRLPPIEVQPGDTFRLKRVQHSELDTLLKQNLSLVDADG